MNYTTQLFSGLALVVICLYVLSYGIYNLFFHPLSNFPGPFLARSSLLWRLIHSMRGRFHRNIDEAHKTYGPVFRVSPGELSFASNGSWKDIYGYKSEKDKESCRKSDFYQIYGSGYNRLCVGSEQDPHKHSIMLRNLYPAFSVKALLDQETIIRECVDRFNNKIKDLQKNESVVKNGLDMTSWFEMVAFDIFGEMAFGESFHAVENEKPHFWPEVILRHLFFVTVLDNMRHYPWIKYFGQKILPWFTIATRDRHSGYTRKQLEKRLHVESSRKDFLTSLIHKVENGEVEKEEMTAHVSTLVIAGGETSSTFLASVTYFILYNRSAYDRLKDEIRSSFRSYKDISAEKAQKLKYLQAVISEGLRIHPPGSHGFPRISPGAFIDGHWVPKGAEIYTSGWSVTHNPSYFHEPFSFKPERWIDPHCKDLKEASRPFSLGPRTCLGKNFALVQANLLLATMFFLYDMELVDKNLDWEKDCRIHVMWWKPKLYVRLTPRAGVEM